VSLLRKNVKAQLTEPPAIVPAGTVADPAAAAPTASTLRVVGPWVLKRLASGLLVLLAVSAIVFVATVALPGDAARTVLGPDASPQSIAALRAQLGLDDPVLGRYLHWLGDLLTGDLGTSLTAKSAVSGILGDRLVNSLVLMFYTSIIAIPGSIALGALLAIRRDGKVDKAVSTTFLALLATPDFVVGTLCVVLFSTTVFELFPATSNIAPGTSPFTAFDQLALPVVALALIAGAYLVRAMRASTIEILDSDYIAMARLRGASERRIIWRHAVPNALVPAVQGSALMLKYLLGGVVVVEFVFSYPGLGSLLRTAVTERDVPLIQAVVLVFAPGTVLFNLIADLLTIYLTPKLRTGAGR
jgi:peptide/nickel transport system permease protein